MKYYLDDGTIIYSHRTARASSQTSKYVLNLIESLGYNEAALDFGCGRLRYSPYLKLKSNNLTLVDSYEQINKVQKIHNEKMCVVDYVRTYMSNTRVIDVDNFGVDEFCYDLVFCSNVLSAIPCEETIKDILGMIRIKLNDKGKALFITQYINSYYSKKDDGIVRKKHLFGNIAINKGNASYYGLIDKNELSNLLTENGFIIDKCWRVDQSAFAICRRS